MPLQRLHAHPSAIPGTGGGECRRARSGVSISTGFSRRTYAGTLPAKREESLRCMAAAGWQKASPVKSGMTAKPVPAQPFSGGRHGRLRPRLGDFSHTCEAAGRPPNLALRTRHAQSAMIATWEDFLLDWPTLAFQTVGGVVWAMLRWSESSGAGSSPAAGAGCSGPPAYRLPKACRLKGCGRQAYSINPGASPLAPRGEGPYSPPSAPYRIAAHP